MPATPYPLEGFAVISPAGSFRIFLSSEPIDFRKGMDGLVAHVANHFELDPFDGAVYVFRSRRADRLKLLVWDGTGLVLTMKRLNGGRFTWPKPQAGPVVLTKVQFDALFDGIDWRAGTAAAVRKPSFLWPTQRSGASFRFPSA